MSRASVQWLGEKLGLCLRVLGILLLQRLHDAGVELLAAGFEQRAVGGVLDQRVLTL